MRVLYDRYANSYSFKFKSKNLFPLQISMFEAPPKQKEATPELTIQQFTQALKDEKMVLLVVSRKGKQDDGNVPMEFIKMLKIF